MVGERESSIGLLQKEAEDLKAALAAAESRRRVSAEDRDADGLRLEAEMEKVEGQTERGEAVDHTFTYWSLVEKHIFGRNIVIII